MSGGPRVVAIGGGHGTAVTLRAARTYASQLTAVVSVADDGGSSGRLRRLLGLPALGDIRKCLVALAPEGSALATAMEHRYAEGELAGHALGNLLLAGLVESTGDLVRGVDEAARLLGAAGRVLPATSVVVELVAESEKGIAEGQVAIAEGGGIRRIGIRPAAAAPPEEAVRALHGADQILIGPGSLYTSVLAAAAVPAVAEALQSTAAQKVYLCNLQPQEPETAGYRVVDHVGALEAHGIHPDVVLFDPSTGMEVGASMAILREASLCGSNGLVHDPARMAEALRHLVA